MPFEIKKVLGGYMVRNLKTGHIHAYHTTLDKAKRQVKLLYMLDSRHRK